MICLVVALLMVRRLSLPSPREYLIIVGLAVVPTILGHSILNHAMRYLRGQVVSVLNLSQFLFAGVLAYLLLGETPRPVFYAAGALVVGGRSSLFTRWRPRKKASGPAARHRKRKKQRRSGREDDPVLSGPVGLTAKT